MDAVTNCAKAHTLKTEALLKYEVDRAVKRMGTVSMITYEVYRIRGYTTLGFEQHSWASQSTNTTNRIPPMV